MKIISLGNNPPQNKQNQTAFKAVKGNNFNEGLISFFNAIPDKTQTLKLLNDSKSTNKFVRDFNSMLVENNSNGEKVHPIINIENVNKIGISKINIDFPFLENPQKLKVILSPSRDKNAINILDEIKMFIAWFALEKKLKLTTQTKIKHPNQKEEIKHSKSITESVKNLVNRLN